MKQKGLAPILTLLFIATAILGFLIYSGTIDLPQKQADQQTTEDPKVDEIANWKTYTNTNSGFSFKYPANTNWQVQIGKIENGQQNADLLSCVGGSECMNTNISTFVAWKSPYKSYEKYLKENTNLHNGSPKLLDSSQTKVAGVNAKEILVLRESGNLEVNYFIIHNDQGYVLSYLLPYDNNQMQVSYESIVKKIKDLPSINPDILSTFTFTQ